MKKVITICLLVATLIAGGMSMDAKTTKKKSNSKARTTQTSSSALWNGDIPSALFIYTLHDDNSERHFKELRKHGYKLDSDNGGAHRWIWEKSNICTVDTDVLDIDGIHIDIETTIWIKDSSSRNKLYNDLKKLIAQKGTANTCSVSLSNGEITFRKKSY